MPSLAHWNMISLNKRLERARDSHIKRKPSICYNLTFFVTMTYKNAVQLYTDIWRSNQLETVHGDSLYDRIWYYSHELLQPIWENVMMNYDSYVTKEQSQLW